MSPTSISDIGSSLQSTVRHHDHAEHSCLQQAWNAGRKDETLGNSNFPATHAHRFDTRVRMIKGLLVFIVLLSLALALYSNVGDAQATVFSGICPSVADISTANGRQFCDSLQTGHLLWAIVFYTSVAIAAAAGAALYLSFVRKV